MAEKDGCCMVVKWMNEEERIFFGRFNGNPWASHANKPSWLIRLNNATVHTQKKCLSCHWNAKLYRFEYEDICHIV